MSIDFLPDAFGISGLNFQMSPMVESIGLRGGQTVASRIGPTLWTATFRSVKLNETKLGQVRGFLDEIEHETAFLGYDVLRRYPLAYRTGWGGLLVGGNPFNGTGKIVTVANSKDITIGNLPASGFTLSPGDYLAFNYGAGDASRALHRVTVGGSTVAGAVTVRVRPRVVVGWAVDAIVDLYRPAAHFKVLPGTVEEEEMPPAYGRISFKAIQAI